MRFKESVLGNSGNHEVTALKYKPVILPIQEKGEVFLYRDQEYIPETLDVVEKVSSRYFDSTLNQYVFTTEIAALIYLFNLSYKETNEDSSLSFKTLEYEYVRSNLDEESTALLFEKLSDFLETAYLNSNKKIESITISPADSSYSVSEIEECIEEILGKTKKYKEEDLRNNYKGFRIFDLYEEIFDKNFGDIHYNSVSKASARSRYFKIKFRQFLKNWEIDENYKSSISFLLKRKE